MSAIKKGNNNKINNAINAINSSTEIVEILAINPNGMSFNEIRKETQLNPNSLTYKLWKLIEAGIAERYVLEPDENRRYSFYKLTDQGMLLVKKLEELRASKIFK